MAIGAGMSTRVDVRVESAPGGDLRVSWTELRVVGASPWRRLLVRLGLADRDGSNVVGARFVAVGQCTVWRWAASGDLVRDYGLIDWLSKQAWLHEKAAERAGKEKS